MMILFFCCRSREVILMSVYGDRFFISCFLLVAYLLVEVIVFLRGIVAGVQGFAFKFEIIFIFQFYFFFFFCFLFL
jgi:hypothetical protein